MSSTSWIFLELRSSLKQEVDSLLFPPSHITLYLANSAAYQYTQTLLEHHKTAKYQTQFLVPNQDPLSPCTCQGIIWTKDSGRLNQIYLVTKLYPNVGTICGRCILSSRSFESWPKLFLWCRQIKECVPSLTTCFFRAALSQRLGSLSGQDHHVFKSLLGTW